MGMFSKKETERSGMMNTTKAFTLMLHFAEQFDPLRHLNSDGKTELNNFGTLKRSSDFEIRSCFSDRASWRMLVDVRLKVQLSEKR
ncbi:unnamed protein product [Caenorhabditis nigoni]